VKEISNNFNEIVSACIKRFVPHKILRKTPGLEYYNKEVKRLETKVKKAYNNRKLGQHHLEELKRLFKQLLTAKKTAQETIFRSILSKEGECWSESSKYVKRRKGHKKNFPAIEDCNGRLITDPIQKKTNFLNYYYSSVFSSEGNTQHIQCAYSDVLFTIETKIIRKRVGAIRNNNTTGPGSISGEILKLGEEAMIPYLAQLLHVTMNNGILHADWKRVIVVPLHKGSDRSLITNYSPVRLTSVV
jgi:hypothetical protein